MTRAMQKFEKAEEKAMAQLFKTAESMRDLYRAAAAADLPGVRGLDDNRITLAEQLTEYGYHLQCRIEARARKGGAS